MKTTRTRQAGFTLHEVMIAVGCATVIGFMAFSVLHMGMVLYAKTTANNLAHDESRIAVNRLVNDIHKGVSTPQLWDATGDPATGLLNVTNSTTAAPCMSFQLIPPNGGPYEIKNDPGDPNLIQVQVSGSFEPVVGMRLIIPMYNIENDIVKIEGNGQHRNIWMKNGEEKIPKDKNGTKTISYFTTRVFYAVEDGCLNTYISGANGNTVITPAIVGGKLVLRNSDGSAPVGATIARYIASAKPFSVPNYPDRRYVGVNLMAEDSHYTNRKFRSTNTLLAGSVPLHSRICNTF